MPLAENQTISKIKKIGNILFFEKLKTGWNIIIENLTRYIPLKNKILLPRLKLYIIKTNLQRNKFRINRL